MNDYKVVDSIEPTRMCADATRDNNNNHHYIEDITNKQQNTIRRLMLSRLAGMSHNN